VSKGLCCRIDGGTRALTLPKTGDYIPATYAC
jgi:hypothetical protein